MWKSLPKSTKLFNATKGKHKMNNIWAPLLKHWILARATLNFLKLKGTMKGSVFVFHFISYKQGVKTMKACFWWIYKTKMQQQYDKYFRRQFYEVTQKPHLPFSPFCGSSIRGYYFVAKFDQSNKKPSNEIAIIFSYTAVFFILYIQIYVCVYMYVCM